jgi:nucleoside-diphosphate-sugar epimerase
MTQKTCAVTGANGFAGGAFCEHFAAMGWHIIKLVRVPEKVEGEARRFVLGEAVTPGLLEGVDLVVHAAYDFSLCSWADIRRVNARGSEALFDAAYKAGVKRQVFISSMAAFEGCRSHYGLGKLLAEEAMCARGGISIRPGMIYSEKNGGLAAKIAAAARILPVVPMIGSGHYPLYTCHIGDLCALVAQLALMENPLPQTITAANDRPVVR